MRDVELEVFKIASAFDNYYRQYGRPLFKRNTLKDSKWWKFFYKTADMYSNLPDWDAYAWVSCQFEKHGKRFPTQLLGQEAFDTFQEYKHRFLKKPNTDEEVANTLINTHKAIRKWASGEIAQKPYHISYLQNKLNLFALERRMVDPTFFTVSKTYIELDEEVKNRIMKKEDFMIKRSSILRNERIKNKMKEILGDDFV